MLGYHIINHVLGNNNNFFQWIGIDDCRKPIKHGPTLAGLPGGFAGDLMRLYPVQSNEQYPLKVFQKLKL